MARRRTKPVLSNEMEKLRVAVKYGADTVMDLSINRESKTQIQTSVAADLADVCSIQIAYSIGVAEPVSLRIDTFGTGKLPDERLEILVEEVYDLTPSGIIEHLDLRRPIYRRTAAYGHFGREEDGFTWEETDLVEIFRDKVSESLSSLPSAGGTALRKS